MQPAIAMSEVMQAAAASSALGGQLGTGRPGAGALEGFLGWRQRLGAVGPPVALGWRACGHGQVSFPRLITQ
jgi:hypothetical protein